MEKGRTFLSFEAFEAFLKHYCSENHVVFVKRSSEGVKDPQLKHLKYETVVFVCKQGQKKHTSKSIGLRPHQRSLKLGCPAKLRLKIMRPANALPHLIITVAELDHQGHDLTTEAASLLPENRRIQVQQKTQILLSCLSLKTSELRAQLEEENGVVLMPHDVYNLKRKVCGRGMDTDSEECEQLVKAIESDGGVVSVGRSERNELEFLFFMTKNMRHMANLYPEVIILDVTYETNQYLYPLLTAMVVDGEGHGVPVMHSYLNTEDRVSMEHCLRLFAQHYTFASTKCFVVDKKKAEISALRAVFPETPVNLCAFHNHQGVKQFLESYHGKIKKLLHEKLTLSSSLRELVRFDNIEIADCRRKLLIKANSVSYDHRDSDETSRTITMCLTRFAADMTKDQLSCARKNCYEVSLLHDSVYSVTYQDKSQQTTSESCSCSFFECMNLPCKHIFVLRDHLGLEVFSTDLVPPRFLLSSSPPRDSFTDGDTLPTVSTPSLSPGTQEARFHKAKSVCDSIVSHLSVLGAEEFSDKISQLQDLLDLWNSSSSSPHHTSGPLSGSLPTVSLSVSVTESHSLDVKPVLPPLAASPSHMDPSVPSPLVASPDVVIPFSLPVASRGTPPARPVSHPGISSDATSPPLPFSHKRLKLKRTLGGSCNQKQSTQTQKKRRTTEV